MPGISIRKEDKIEDIQYNIKKGVCDINFTINMIKLMLWKIHILSMLPVHM